MNSKEKLDSSKYCYGLCERLYGGKCIMRVDGKYSGSFRLQNTNISKYGKLYLRYIRREDCPLKQ
jgi:hypothetical protein